MKLTLFAAIAGAIALSACGHGGGGSIGPITDPVIANPANPTVTERAYADALIGYNTVAATYLDLDSRGLLPPDVKAQAKRRLEETFADLRIARAFLDAANVASAAPSIDAAIRVTQEIIDLLPKGH